MDAAERPRDVGSWQLGLAQALATAARSDAAGVFLSTLGNLSGPATVVAPAEHTAAGARLIEALLPRAQATAGLESTWVVTASSGAIGAGVNPALPGFAGMIGRFLRSEDGIVAGGIVLFTHAPVHRRLTEVGAPFARVCRAAETTLRGALAMAAALGARFPRMSPAALSEREREVATLAASGFSDVNIGARLGISEGTVGRHLHNIYRKLGIGSRMALSDLLCGPVALDPLMRIEAA